MIDLNDLLAKAGLEPTRKDHVLVMRHKPTAAKLRKQLPWFAEEHPDLYNAYQSQHGKAEASLERAKYLVSMIGSEPGKALFVGVYVVEGARRISPREFWAQPLNRMLGELGTRGPGENDSLWFTLRLTPHLQHLKGRLVVRWVSERPYYQWAARNNYSVLAIHDESRLVKQMPEWRDLVITWQELKGLPNSWRETLAQWRGIYYIFDTKTRSGYVGSAAGAENLYGRWRYYDRTGDGGNKLLKLRDPADFVFSILERVSPDLPPSDIVAIENQWKDRLHTRHPLGLNDN